MTRALRPRASESPSKTYLRDGRAPVPIRVSTSEVMRANRAHSTGPELAMRGILSSVGLTDFLANSRGLPGRPDIAFPDVRLAVFVHGCFWHHCPHCKLPPPKAHAEFWIAKFRANRSRDARKARALRSRNWSVLTVWECQIRDQPDSVGRRVLHAVQREQSTIRQP